MSPDAKPKVAPLSKQCFYWPKVLVWQRSLEVLGLTDEGKFADEWSK